MSFAPPSANAVVVTVNGITQNHPENYGTNGAVLTFTDPPAVSSVIRVLQQAMIGTSIVPIDGSVGTSKLASGLTLSGSTTINTLVSSGATLSGGSINNMTIGGTTANTGAFTTLSASGVATFSAGSAGAPALTTSGDTNTGIFFPAADTIAFTEGGVESMRIDANGYMGIGTTSPGTKLEIKGTHVSGRGLLNLVADSGTRYSTLSFTNNVTQRAILFHDNTDNMLDIYGAAGQGLRFTTNDNERMRLDSSGNVGIGTSSPQMRVDVSGGVRVQSISNPSSGSGMELAYDGTQGIIQAYSNRATLASVPVFLVTGQLKFPATQNPSSDANTLDDYEEGTFSPTFLGSSTNPTVTYTNQGGFYTKIGNMVYISCNVQWSGFSGGSGLLFFGNLPFAANGSNFQGGGVISYAFGLPNKGFLYMDGGTNRFVTQTSASPTGYFNVNEVASSGHIMFGMFYRV